MRLLSLNLPVGRLNEKNRSFLFLVILFLFGILVGAIICARADEETKSHLIGTLKAYTAFNTDISFYEMFISSFLNNLFFFGVAFLAGLLIIGFPFSIVLILYKGFSVGLTIGFICSIYGFKGLLICLLCIIPQVLITSITLILACCKSIEFSFSLFNLFGKGRRQKTTIPNLSSYCMSYLFLFLISLTTLLFDAYISPFFLKILF